MRIISLLIICLCFLLPLVSAVSYDSILTEGDVQSLDFGDLYIIAPENVYFGEEFSIVAGIEILNASSQTNILSLNGLTEEVTPTIWAENTNNGGSFLIHEWNITLWNPETFSLRIENNQQETFSKEFLYNPEFKKAKTTDVISSESHTYSLPENDVSTEARVALAGVDKKYSQLEFQQMQKSAEEKFTATKRVEKILETYDDNSTQTKTVVTISVNVNEGFEGSYVDIVEVIPKDVVDKAKKIITIPESFVVKEDPVIMWHVTGVQADVSYEVASDVEVTGHTVMISSMVAADTDSSFPWKIVGPLLIIPLIAGIIVFFAKFEPKTKN